MRLMFHIALYIIFINCKRCNGVYEKELKILDKKTSDLKIIDDNDEISIKMKIQDYFPHDATWISGNESIGFASHYIDGVLQNSWSEKLKNVENKKDYMIKYLNGLRNNDVEFKVHKKNFENEKGPIKCQIDLIKMENYKNIMNEYSNDISSIDTSNFTAKQEAAQKMRKKIDSNMITFDIKFNNFTSGILDLDDYEISVYMPKTNNKKDIVSKKDLFFKGVIDVVLTSIITVAFFGSLIFAVKYSLSKYF